MVLRVVLQLVQMKRISGYTPSTDATRVMSSVSEVTTRSPRAPDPTTTVMSMPSDVPVRPHAWPAARQCISSRSPTRQPLQHHRFAHDLDDPAISTMNASGFPCAFRYCWVAMSRPYGLDSNLCSLTVLLHGDKGSSPVRHRRLGGKPVRSPQPKRTRMCSASSPLWGLMGCRRRL